MGSDEDLQYGQLGRPSPTHTVVVRKAVRVARKRLPDAQRQAEPLSLADMRNVMVRLPIVAPNSPAALRDQVMIGVGWAGALHPGELVGLDIDNVHLHGDADVGDGGVFLWLRSRKTEPTGGYVAIPFANRRATCPARKLLLYLRSRRRPSGPVFCRIDRHGHEFTERLTRRSVTPIVRRAVTTCLYRDTDRIEANSLRAGFVTECRDRGVDDQAIMRQTRHVIPGQRSGGILNVYDRPLDLLKRHALDPTWW